MNARGLMFRARELLHQHSLGAAMVIVPLAMAAPVAADSVSFLYDSDNSGVSGYYNGTSGGAFGNIYGAVQPGGATVCLTGDTMSVPGQKAFPAPGYVPGSLAADGTTQLAFGPNQGGAPTIYYAWTGEFTDNVTPGTQFLLSYNLGFTGIPKDAAATTVAPISWWGLQAVAYDANGNPVIYSDQGSALESGLTDKFSNNGPLTSGGDLLLDPGGAADTWTVYLFVQWNASSGNPADELSVDPHINLSLIPGVSSGDAGGAPPTPLPSAFGMGGLLLAAWGAFYSSRHFTRRAARKY